MRKEYVFNRVVDFFVAGVELAKRDAKKGDSEAIEFLNIFSDLSNKSNRSRIQDGKRTRITGRNQQQ